jgi:hypothetical protein
MVWRGESTLYMVVLVIIPAISGGISACSPIVFPVYCLVRFGVRRGKVGRDLGFDGLAGPIYVAHARACQAGSH